MQIVKIGVLGYATMSCALAMGILHVYMFMHIRNGFLVIVVMRQLHVPDTCRTRAGHVRPSPINFLTSKTPV